MNGIKFIELHIFQLKIQAVNPKKHGRRSGRGEASHLPQSWIKKKTIKIKKNKYKKY
jgi:hypothetical protein